MVAAAHHFRNPLDSQLERYEQELKKAGKYVSIRYRDDLYTKLTSSISDAASKIFSTAYKAYSSASKRLTKLENKLVNKTIEKITPDWTLKYTFIPAIAIITGLITGITKTFTDACLHTIFLLDPSIFTATLSTDFFISNAYSGLKQTLFSMGLLILHNYLQKLADENINEKTTNFQNQPILPQGKACHAIKGGYNFGRILGGFTINGQYMLIEKSISILPYPLNSFGYKLYNIFGYFRTCLFLWPQINKQMLLQKLPPIKV
jgi:hypothetical protein